MGASSSTPTNSVNKSWLVHCNDDNVYKRVFSDIEPTECPTDVNHTIDMTKTIDTGEFMAVVGGVEVCNCKPEDGDVLSYSESRNQWKATGRSITLLEDVKNAGVNGGTFDDGSWITRDLNTISETGSSTVTLNSNRFTMEKGTYYIAVQAPAFGVKGHRVRLYNTTDSVVAAEGSTHWSQNDLGYAILTSVITLTSSKTFEIQHRCTRGRNHTGFGMAVAFDASTETYTTVQIIRVK